MPKIRVGIIISAGEIGGGGGVERQFFSFVQNVKSEKYAYYLVLDNRSATNVQSALGELPKSKLLTFSNWNNRFGLKLNALEIAVKCKFFGIKHLHIANFNAFYSPLYSSLKQRFSLTLNQVDCRYSWENSDSRYNSFNSFLGSTSINGIFTWYKAVSDKIQSNFGVTAAAAKSCFVDENHYKPMLPKIKQVIFAARLSDVKRPFLFVDFVHELLKREQDLANKWQFSIYGDGELKKELQHYISKLHLTDNIELSVTNDLSEVFGKSSIFVSTQAYENFTSLSMLEAMSARNAILAFNVGQTSEFAAHNYNALLCEDGDVEAMADNCLKLMQDDTLLNEMQENSRNKVLNQFTLPHFQEDFEAFLNHSLNV